MLFLAVSIGAAGWLASFSALYESRDAERALEWARLGSFFSDFIPAAIFHFSVVFVGRRRQFRAAVVFSWLFCATIAILAVSSNLFLRGVNHYPWGYYLRGALINLSWISVCTAMLVGGVYLIWRASHELEGVSRDGARAMVFAFIIASLALVDFLPTIGIGIRPYGFLAILGSIAFAANSDPESALLDRVRSM